MIRLSLFVVGTFILAVSADTSNSAGKRGDGKDCRDFETPCGTTCCNNWRWTCNSYDTKNGDTTTTVHECIPDAGVLSSDRMALILFMPIVFIPVLLILIALSAKHGFGNSGDAGVAGKVVIIMSIITAFLTIFELFTPACLYGLLIAMMAFTSIYAMTSANWKVIMFAFLFQISIFLSWNNPYSGNPFLATHGEGFVGDMVSWTTEAVYGSGTGDAVSCAGMYRSYFKHVKGNVEDTNNRIPSWGYCGRHWLSFNFVMMMAQAAMNVLLMVFTFVHLTKNLPS